MSVFRLMGAAVLAMTGLAGCEGGFGLDSPPARMMALGGGITAAGPEGYCIDPAASRGTGFAVIAGCQTIAGQPTRPAINGLVTVQVGAAGSAAVTGSEPAFRAFLDTDGGRQVLSRAGDATTVDLRSTGGDAGRIDVVFDDSAPTPLAGLQQREWRAFVDLNGRLVTIAVRGLAADPLGDYSGNALLDQAVAAILAANAPQAATET